VRRSRFGLACFLLAVYCAPYACAEPLGHAIKTPESSGPVGTYAGRVSRRARTVETRATFTPHADSLAWCGRAACTGTGQRSSLVAACVAEVRWQRPVDCAAQWHILARYAAEHGTSIATATRVLVWRWSRPPAWVLELGPACRQPSSWPDRLRWSAHAPLCRALYARARAFLAGRVADPCPTARGWRAPHSAIALLASGRRRANCGDTANVFFE
jgi:hypothetical protein